MNPLTRESNTSEATLAGPVLEYIGKFSEELGSQFVCFYLYYLVSALVLNVRERPL